MEQAQFFVGQIVEHSLFGYRGVIYGVDFNYANSESWYKEMSESKPDLKPDKEQPWYRLMVDETEHVTYVAQSQLTESGRLQEIEHPALTAYFSKYNGHRYFFSLPH